MKKIVGILVGILSISVLVILLISTNTTASNSTIVAFSISESEENLNLLQIDFSLISSKNNDYRGRSRGGSERHIDSDGDGYTNIEEMLAGTDPYDANNYPGKDVTSELITTPVVSPIPTTEPIVTPTPIIFPSPTPIIDTPAEPEASERSIWWLIGLVAVIGFILAAIFFLRQEGYW